LAWPAWPPVWRSSKVANASEEMAVIYVTDLIVVLLFVYLGAALVRPEWF
jgi:hypothetical protein